MRFMIALSHMWEIFHLKCICCTVSTMTLLLNDIISTDAEHRDTDPLEQCNQQCNSATVQQCIAGGWR